MYLDSIFGGRRRTAHRARWVYHNSDDGSQAQLKASFANTNNAINNVQVDPAVQKATADAGTNLGKINSGDFSGIGAVDAVTGAANRIRSFTAAPLGDAALASNAAGGSGYSTQLNEQRNRQLDESVATATLGAVKEERAYDQNMLMGGAQYETNTQLGKAGLTEGTINPSLQFYQFARRPSWFGQNAMGLLGGGAAGAAKAFGT